MTNRHWTAAEDKKMLDAWDAGTTREAVAALLPGRTMWAVNSRLSLLGAGRQKYTFRNGPAEPWTTEDDDMLEALTRKGYGYKEIAAELNRTYCAVANRAHRQGLTKKALAIDSVYVAPAKVGKWPADMPHFQNYAHAVPPEPRYVGGRKRTNTLGGVSEYG
jgi:hypothetical protein